jgi:uncharacterized membrane protein (UPF0182 family)
VTRRRRLGLLIAASAALVLIVGRIAAGLFVRYEWYDALGARDLWMTRLGNELLLRAITAGSAMLFALANLYAVRLSIASVVLPRRMGDLEIGEELPARYLNAAVVILAALVGLVLALPEHNWTALVLARHGVPFAESEAYFEHDLGFFVYWLPFETDCYVRALWTLAAVTALVVVLYFFFTPGLKYEKAKLTMSTHVRRHVALLALFAFGALAWSYRLDMYGALTSGSGSLGAFAYADNHVGIPVNLVLSFVTLAFGFMVAFAMWRDQRRTALVLVTCVLLIPYLALKGGPWLAEQLATERDATRRERPYQVIRALYTNQAFGADSAHMPDAPASLAIESPAELARDVSVWDPATIVQSLSRARRGASVFGAQAWRESPAGPIATAIERPVGGGRWMGIRVLASGEEPQGSVLRVDSLGRSDLSDLALPPALIQEGASGDTVITDSAGVVAAPVMEGWVTRLAHAWIAQNLRLLSEDQPERNARVVRVRDVRERVRSLVPFFALGSVVWPAVVGDSLWWVVDLYAASNDYPLSAHLPFGDSYISYFQHAGVAFVEAYTGRVLLARDQALDPIAQTWVNEFPGLFTPWDRVPAALAAQAPPRTDQALVAAVSYLRRSTERGDSTAPIRAITPPATDSSTAGGQNAIVSCFALPAAPSACTWSLPLLDSRERVAGLILAIGGSRAAVLRYRARAEGPRWTTVGDRLERPTDSVASANRIIEGRLRSVPYRTGVAFIRPEYSWPADLAPDLDRVAVVTNDTASSGRTLAQALGLGPSVQRPAPAPTTAAEFRARVLELYDAMQTSLKRGDLTGFAAQFNELGRILGRPRSP